jgi:hypothetical protein
MDPVHEIDIPGEAQYANTNHRQVSLFQKKSPILIDLLVWVLVRAPAFLSCAKDIADEHGFSIE